MTNVTVSPVASPPTCQTFPVDSRSAFPRVVFGGIEHVNLVQNGDVDFLVLPDVDAFVLAPCWSAAGTFVGRDRLRYSRRDDHTPD